MRIDAARPRPTHRASMYGRITRATRHTSAMRQSSSSLPRARR
jgi:hypothetical protein